MAQFKQFSTTVGGREVVIETGKYAEQANGACVVRCGDTAVLVTVCMSASPREGMDFFPLQVDYDEKMYSVGKIPGGFKKREGRASDKAILTARLIDRPLRPLFPKGLYNDVTVVAQALSVEPDVSPEPLAMIGSSVALSISDIPWAGPTGSVVVGMVDGKYVINPDLAQRQASTIHLNLAGTKDAILMIEAGADEVSNEEMVGAIMFGHEEIKKICAFIEDEIVPAVGKPKKEMELYHIPEELDKTVREYASSKIDWAIDTFDRQEREARQAQAEQEREQLISKAIELINTPSRFEREIIDRPDSKAAAVQQMDDEQAAVAFRFRPTKGEDYGMHFLAFTRASLLRLLTRVGCGPELLDALLDAAEKSGLLDQRGRTIKLGKETGQFVTFRVEKF